MKLSQMNSTVVYDGKRYTIVIYQCVSVDGVRGKLINVVYHVCHKIACIGITRVSRISRCTVHDVPVYQ